MMWKCESVGKLEFSGRGYWGGICSYCLRDIRGGFYFWRREYIRGLGDV